MAVTDLIPWRRPEPARREEHALTAFEREMGRLFERFLRGGMLAPFGESWGAFRPSVDVVETDDKIKVSAELPGLDDKDIEVSLDRGVLTRALPKAVVVEGRKRISVKAK